MLERKAAARTFKLQPLQGGRWKRYSAALLVMAAAVALRSVFQPILGGMVYHTSILAATAFAALYCGVGPAILSTVLGNLAANVLFLPVHHPLGTFTKRDVVGELLFLAFSAAVIALGEGGRRAWLSLGRVHEALLRSRMQLKFRVRQRTAQLQQSNQDLRDLSARLLRVQDDERRRIARDLHDSTGQSLTALKLELAGIERELAARDPELGKRLAATMETARQISDELRTISYLLHPPLLDELGLGSALRWFMDGFEKRSGIKVRLELRTSGRLPPEMETMLFRVVQECLINVHRHSGSPTATVCLSQREGQIIVEVEDEGCGISSEELADISSGAAPSVGFRGMRERVKDFSGELEILSSGHGTKVRAIVPVDVKRGGAVTAGSAAGIPGDTAENPPNVIGFARGASAN